MVDCRFWGERLPQVVASLAATVGVFAFGTTLGWSSPALPSLESTKPFEISLSTKAWISSIVVLGAAFSCPLAGLFAEKLGRKRTIILMSLPFMLGWLMVSFATSAATLQVGRFITGFCGGTYSVTVPMYISEVTDSQIRGRLGTCFQIMLVLGILFSYVIGSFVSWFWLSICCTTIPFFVILLMIFMPETPHFLLSRGKLSEASRKLCWLRSAGLSINVDHELRQMQGSIAEAKNSRANCRELFSGHVLRPTGLCLGLMLFQQLSGANAVTFNAHTIFEDAGAQIDVRISAIVIASAQVLATIVSSILVDKSGRRFLFLLSEILVTISLIILGLYFYLRSFGTEYTEDIGFLPLLGLCIFSIAFALGLGPLPWILMGEVLPQNVKGLTSAMTAMLSWILAFVVIQFYQQFQDYVGDAWCWWIFAIWSIVGILFTYFLLPETSGKTLEEIQRGFIN